jgi:hypothetical protein
MYFPSQTSGIMYPRPTLSATGSTVRFPLLLGLATGLAGSIFLVSQLLLIGPITTTEAAVQANLIWVATTVVCWITSGAILCLINPVAGPAKVFIAGPLSLSVCTLGVAVFWFASKDSAPLDALLSIWFPAMARGLAVSTIIIGLVIPVRYAIPVTAGIAKDHRP